MECRSTPLNCSSVKVAWPWDSQSLMSVRLSFPLAVMKLLVFGWILAWDRNSVVCLFLMNGMKEYGSSDDTKSKWKYFFVVWNVPVRLPVLCLAMILVSLICLFFRLRDVLSDCKLSDCSFALVAIMFALRVLFFQMMAAFRVWHALFLNVVFLILALAVRVSSSQRNFDFMDSA